MARRFREASLTPRSNSPKPWNGLARSGAFLLAVGALAGMSGCFQYIPVQPESVGPEEEVVVHVSNEAAVHFTRYFGDITQRLEGRLTPLNADEFEVSVWIGRDYPGTDFHDVRQSVTLDRRDVVAVERRELSVIRTALFTVGVLGGFALLAAGVRQFDDDRTPDTGDPLPDPPDPADLIVPRMLWR